MILLPPLFRVLNGKRSNGELRFSFSPTNHQMLTSGKVATRNYPRWVGSRVLGGVIQLGWDLSHGLGQAEFGKQRLGSVGR